MPTTLACNREDVAKIFKKRVAEGYAILHIAFSSALSSSYNNCCIAAREEMEEYLFAKFPVYAALVDDKYAGYVVCRIKLKDGKIASMDEHWADDGEAPKWRQDMKIGRKIK